MAGGRLYSPRGSLGYTGLGAGLEGWNTLHGRRGSGGRRRGRIGMRGGCDGSKLLLVACVMFCPCKNLKEEGEEIIRGYMIELVCAVMFPSPSSVCVS